MTPINVAAFSQPLTTSGGLTDALHAGYRWNGVFTPEAGVPETIDGRAPPDHTISWSACIAIADGMQFNDDQGRHSELFPETNLFVSGDVYVGPTSHPQAFLRLHHP